MKIRAFRMKGFGFYDDSQIAEVSAGLTVVYAANGGGKTTLRDFFRHMLFEWKPRGRKYPLWRGSGNFGSVIFTGDDGTGYLLERRNDGKTLSLAREDGGESAGLAAILGSVNAEIYTSVFAIGLDELSGIDGDTAEHVRNMVGSVGSVLPLAGARKELTDERDSLLAPRAMRPINLLMKQIQVAERDRAVAAREESHYFEYEATVSDLGEQLAALRAAMDAKRTESARLLTIEKAWPEWVELERARAKLAALEVVVERFPADGPRRLDDLLEQRSRGARSLGEARARRDLIAAQRAAIRPDPEIIANAEEVIALTEGSSAFEAAGADLARAEQAKEELAARLAELLRRLGGWSVEQALSFDDSTAAIAEHDRLADAAANADADARHADGDRNSASASHAAAVTEEDSARRDARRRWDTPPPSPETSDRLLEAVARAGAALRDRATVAARRDGVEAKRRAYADDLLRLDKQTEAESCPEGRGAIRRWLPVVSAVIAAALIVVSLRAELPASVRLPAAFAAVVILTHLGVALVGRRSAERESRAHAAARHEDTKRREDEIARELAAVTAEVDRLDREIEHEGVALGLDRVDEVALETRAEAIRLDRRERRCYDDAQVVLHGLEAQAARLRGEVAQAADRVAEAGSRAEAARGAWRAWLTDRGIAADVPLATVREILRILSEARDAERDRRLAAERAAALSSRLAAHVDRINRVRERVNESRVDPSSALSATAALRARLSAAQELADRDRDLALNLSAAEAECDSLVKSAAEVEAATSALLGQGDALDVEEFRSRSEAWMEKLALNARIERCLASLAVLSGPGAPCERLQAELRETDAERIRLALDCAAREILANEDRANSVAAEIGRLQNEMSRLASSERLADLERQVEAERAELTDLSEEWATRALGLWLLDRARREYEERHQPAILRGASAYLDAITGGDYPHLFQEYESREYRVRSRDRRNKEEPWNRGLREQVYLSIRFGIIDDYCSRAEALPIILDDVLVNCDREHAAGAVRCISEMAVAHQIFYFTCHPETLTLFRHNAPNADYHTIAGKAFTPAS